MVQVNLIGKKRRERAGRNWFVIGITALFIIFSLYFLGSAIFVVVRLVQINRELSRIDQEAETISRQISANKDTLTRYVLSKYILERVDSLIGSRFRYKDYLDQISKLIPANSVLTNVDFSVRGWVAASVSLRGINLLRELENSLMDGARLAQSEFSTVFAESVNSDRNGVYTAKLHFQIKANGGK